MAGGKELGSGTTESGGRNLKEIMARTTLKDVHSKGHPYVEIREDGKRFIFFCTLCLAPCYSDSTLFDHLKGNIHSQRYATAQATLFGPLPWPFSDGVLLFHISPEESGQQNLLQLESRRSTHQRASLQTCLSDSVSGEQSDVNVDLRNYEDQHLLDGHKQHLLVPEVLINDEKSVLDANLIGFGQIGFRIDETDNKISRIWCEYLGNVNSDSDVISKVPSSDFAMIIFSYKYELGRFNLVDGLDQLGQLGYSIESDACGKGRKKPKLLTETRTLGDGSDCFTDLSNSTKDAIISQDDGTNKSLVVHQSNKLLLLKSTSNKAIRKELRKQQRLAAERMCDICQQKMLPEKDVATIFNIRTGKLACSSRNTHGVYHVFHVSCLIHWILLSEYEIWTGQSTNPIHSETFPEKPKRKRRAKSSKTRKIENEIKKTDLVSVICPECQGSGVDIGKADDLEKPVIPLSKMYLYKVKANEAHQAWMKSPETLSKCCIGLHFPRSSDEDHQEKVSSLKLLRFYRATE